MLAEFHTETRGYTLQLEKDLLGDFILYRRWYGLRNRRWGTKRQVFAEESLAMREFDRVEKIRVKRGYVRFQPPS